MRKITYTNSVNGLSAEFSSDNPLMHLDLKNFDGSSVGATQKALQSPLANTVICSRTTARIIMRETAEKQGGT